MKISLKDIKRIWLTDEAIHIETKNGRAGKELFTDYPRLKDATASERKKYETSEFGIHWPVLDEDLSFNGFFRNRGELSAIGKIFAGISEINVSAFARKVGIAQPLLADYISGKKKPSEKQYQKILKCLHELGRELQSL